MSKWIEEELEPGLRVMYGLKEQLRSSTSKFQTVDVVDLEPFGRTLLIDGLIQSCQVDEFVYHESLVHPALLSHPCPKSVYIGGGGEGSTAREVLRHSTVERCVMVDIDEDVVSFCRENLPENSEAFKDSRLELVIDDAKAVLEQSPTGFDIIIMDLDDPLEGGPCYQLYTVEVSARAACGASLLLLLPLCCCCCCCCCCCYGCCCGCCHCHCCRRQRCHGRCHRHGRGRDRCRAGRRCPAVHRR